MRSKTIDRLGLPRGEPPFFPRMKHFDMLERSNLLNSSACCSAQYLSLESSALMKRMFGVMVSAAMLSACAVPPPVDPGGPASARVPEQWFVPATAHQGQTGNLTQWWGQFNDPVLVKWIARAQEQSPTLAAARAQVFAARAAYQTTEVLAGPQVAAVASASRGQSFDEATIVGTSLGLGLQASWAIDLWGGNRAGVAQAGAQQTAALAGWHDARVLVASELAQSYFAQRLCQAQ